MCPTSIGRKKLENKLMEIKIEKIKDVDEKKRNESNTIIFLVCCSPNLQYIDHKLYKKVDILECHITRLKIYNSTTENKNSSGYQFPYTSIKYEI